MQVNEGVREKENSDRLEFVQRTVNCDGVIEVSKQCSYLRGNLMINLCRLECAPVITINVFCLKEQYHLLTSYF